MPTLRTKSGIQCLLPEVKKAAKRKLVLVMKPFVNRCGTPDCDWSHKVHDMGEYQLQLCYAEFRKHCRQMHDLREWDTTSRMHLDLENWLLALIKT